jgi:Mor family transcriptional regulator
MIEKSIIENISVKALPNQCQEFLQCMDIQTLVSFMEYFGGTSVYVPKVQSVLREVKKDSIIREYNKGLSYRELARKYKLSERWIREICNNDNN